MISHKDIMTGSLGMARAGNSLLWPLSAIAAERVRHVVDRVPVTNFINAIAIIYLDRDYQ